jgi:hypothetical protein
MKRSKITPRMLELMSPEDQAKYRDNFAVRLAEANRQINAPGPDPLERVEHRMFISWLSLHGFECYRHARTDKRTTEPCGVPDFSVYDRVRLDEERTPITPALLIEFKRPGRKLELIQELWASHCRGVVHVVHGAQEAIQLVTKYFGL